MAHLLYLVNRSELSYRGGSATATKFYFLLPGGKPVYYVDWDNELVSTLQDGHGYEIEYEEGNFNGEPRIQKIHKLSAADVNISEYMKSSHMSAAQLSAKILDAVDEIKNPEIRSLCHKLISPGLFTSPAAKKVHNNWIGGLAEHGIALLNIARPAYHHYLHYFPTLDWDKIVFGCLFHDWGKTLEYDSDGLNIEISKRGELTPHIVIGIVEVAKAAEDTIQTPGLLDELLHIIASHHGRLEWGSPVQAKTVEAKLIHSLDMLDSDLMHVYNIFQGTGEEVAYSSIDRHKYIKT